MLVNLGLVALLIGKIRNAIYKRFRVQKSKIIHARVFPAQVKGVVVLSCLTNKRSVSLMHFD